MGKPSAPQAPNPTQTADEQIRVNQSTIDQLANANRINQVNPLGSSNWTKDPTTGTWTQTQTVDPRVQQQIDQGLVNTDLRLGSAGNAMQNVLNSGTAGTAIDPSKLPGITSSVSGPGLVSGVDQNSLPGMSNTIAGGDAGSLKQAQDATYNQLTSRLDPQWTQQENDLKQSLQDQGVPQGSDAWNKAMDQFNRAKTDAYSTASNAAVSQGNALEQQLFGEHATQGQFANSANSQAFNQLLANAGFMNTAAGQQFQQNLQAGQFGNSASAQALAQLLQERMAPISEANALSNGATPNMPQFGSGQGDITPAGAPNMGNLVGQQYQGELNAYNTNVGSQNSMYSTLGSLLGSALLFCSRDFKEPIAEFTGAAEIVKSLPVDRWRYKGDHVEHIGTYAEDFHKATGVGNGTFIHLIDLLGVLTGAVKELVARVEKLEAA